jgi:hypothetical protein
MNYDDIERDMYFDWFTEINICINTHSERIIWNNSKFCDFVDRIYSIEFEIKDTTDT